jgi:predicted DNA binding CopG/RHH family protein
MEKLNPISVREAARRLEISYALMRGAVRNGLIRTIRIGDSRPMIAEKELHRFRDEVLSTRLVAGAPEPCASVTLRIAIVDLDVAKRVAAEVGLGYKEVLTDVLRQGLSLNVDKIARCIGTTADQLLGLGTSPAAEPENKRPN